MKTEGYITNHLSTALVQVTSLEDHCPSTYRQHTMNGRIQKKKIPSLTSEDSSLFLNALL